jgi:hypothetical protein
MIIAMMFFLLLLLLSMMMTAVKCNIRRVDGFPHLVVMCSFLKCA